MKMVMFSMFDAAAAAFLPPVFLRTEAVMLQSLRDLPKKEPQHPLVQHPEQYTVFVLGEFEDSDGSLKVRPPEAVINLKVLFSQGELELRERPKLHDVLSAREHAAGGGL